MQNFPFSDGQVHRERTDAPLSSGARDADGMRYSRFRVFRKGGRCLIESCEDGYLKRVVGVKSLRIEFADDPIQQQRFLREARVSAMLQHPNTISVYDLSRNRDGRYYFTMQLIEGGQTIRDVINESIRQSKDDPATYYRLVADIVLQVCRALRFSHSLGIVHRDIKPENILLGRFQEVFLIDWGLAKVWNEEELPSESTTSTGLGLTEIGGIEGTPSHMSPEQLTQANAIDTRTDIFSLGVVLYELLTGENMLSPSEIDKLVDTGEFTIPVLPSDRAPHRSIPPWLERICVDCVRESPEDRIQSAEDIITRMNELTPTKD